jgi:Zn-dependent protease with chaperone function
MTLHAMEAETVLADALLLTSLWLAAGLAAGALLARTRPGRAHALVLAGLLGAVAAPALAAGARVLGLGLLGPPAVASLATGGGPPLGPWGRGAIFDGGLSGFEIAVAVWGSISALLLLRLGLSAVRASRLVRGAQPAPETYQDIARRVAAGAGLAVVPLICLTPVVRSPVIWCWGRRPRVLLPSLPTPDPELEGVLCHEFAHLLRRDHVAALLAELAVCLLPWHPLAWVAARHRRGLSERACDARVLAAGAPAERYARTLLALAARPQARIGLAAVSSRSGLRRRLTWILETGPVRSESGRRFGFASAGVAALAVTVSGLAHHAAPAEREAAPPAHENDLPPLPPVAPGSGIVIAPVELDLGEVAPNEIARGFVWLLNAGTEPRRVTAARPDCGCTTVPTFVPTTLASGESLRLEITMKAPALGGTSKKKNVTFSIDGQPPLKLPVLVRTGPS